MREERKEAAGRALHSVSRSPGGEARSSYLNRWCLLSQPDPTSATEAQECTRLIYLFQIFNGLTASLCSHPDGHCCYGNGKMQFGAEVMICPCFSSVYKHKHINTHLNTRADAYPVAPFISQFVCNSSSFSRPRREHHSVLIMADNVPDDLLHVANMGFMVQL